MTTPVARSDAPWSGDDAAARPEPAAARLDWLDWARAVLMLLGLLVHAEQYLLPAARPGAERVAWDVAGDLVTIFRMPAFFLVGGFFAHLVLGKRGPGGFLRERVDRLLLPAVATYLLLLLPARALTGASVDFIPDSLRDLAHVWFLPYLLLALAIVVALRRLAPARLPAVSPWTVALALTFALHILVRVAMALPDGARAIGPLHLPTLASGVVFVAAGYALARAPGAFSAAFAWRSGLLAAAALLAALHVARQAGLVTLPGELRIALGHAASTFACVGVLMLFRRFAGVGSVRSRYLSAAAFAVYLVHLPVILLLVGPLARVEPLSARMGLGMAITAAVALAFYQLLVRRGEPFALLFGGRARWRLFGNGSARRSAA